MSFTLVLLWLLCGATGVYLFQFWWRRDFDLQVGDLLYAFFVLLLTGPFGMIYIVLIIVLDIFANAEFFDKTILKRKD